MFQSLFFILFFVGIHANESNPSGADVCRCYCCPSEINPYKDKSASCDPHKPPLVIEALIIKVGSVPIGVGAGDLACNALACSGYFSIECPPPGMKSSRGAAVLAGCNACSQGRFISKVLGTYGNGSSSKGDQSDIDKSLKDYVDKGNALESTGVKARTFLKLFF
jgi:hypothetical protein